MRYLFVNLLLIISCSLVNAQTITITEQGHPTSIRGLSVVDDHVAWVSGSKGTLALSTNGGKTWRWQQVKGFEQADFRDIEAFSAKEAIIMSSGTPALILKTIDGGQTWQQVYRNDDKAYFLDAMDFTPDGKHGYVLGDPIDGKFLMLETTDGGKSWNKFKYMPDALPGEAAFAASGTCLRVNKNRQITMVTGGTYARLLRLSSSKQQWYAIPLPLSHGVASKGAFSISDDEFIAAGGDYANPTRKDSVSCAIMVNYALDTKLAKTGPAGYQSCIEHIAKATYLSTGTSGSNLTTNGGQTWKQIDTNSFNVCRKAKKGSLVLLAGDQGKIAVFKN